MKNYQKRVGLLWLLIIILMSAVPARAAVDPARLERLSRGVNLAEWFWGFNWDGDPSFDLKGHLQTHLLPSDFAEIRSLGFTHVRLPIDPVVLFDPDNPATLKPDYLPELDAAITNLNAADLAVIVDMHVWDDVKRGLAFDDAFVADFAAFWQSLATYLNSRDP